MPTPLPLEFCIVQLSRVFAYKKAKEDFGMDMEGRKQLLQLLFKANGIRLSLTYKITLVIEYSSGNVYQI